MCAPKRRKNSEIYVDQSQHRTLISTLFLPSSNGEKICWGRGFISLPLFQSFFFKFYMAKLSLWKKSGLLFCLTLVQYLESNFFRGSGSGSVSDKTGSCIIVS